MASAQGPGYGMLLATVQSITSSVRASNVDGSEAEGFGGLEIDHRFVPSRHLHWLVGWLLALEDAINVAGSVPELVDDIRPIGDHPASGNNVAFEIDSRQFAGPQA